MQLDTSPLSSAGSVFIARDEDGGAFAVWIKDNTWKQAYYNPTTATFDVHLLNLVIPIGPPSVFAGIAALGVSPIGTVAVLGARNTTGFDTAPQFIISESGSSLGEEPTPTPSPVPETTATPITTVPSDACPTDPNKTTPGVCGCGFGEIDSNGDLVTDCGVPGSITVRGGILSNAPVAQTKIEHQSTHSSGI